MLRMTIKIVKDGAFHNWMEFQYQKIKNVKIIMTQMMIHIKIAEDGELHSWRQYQCQKIKNAKKIMTQMLVVKIKIAQGGGFHRWREFQSQKIKNAKITDPYVDSKNQDCCIRWGLPSLGDISMPKDQERKNCHELDIDGEDQDCTKWEVSLLEGVSMM